MRKKCLLGILCLVLMGLPQPTLACYGARPLGMGGAYVALAEGAEALYWNPGGLVLGGQFSFSATQTIPGESLNYQSFFGLAWRRGKLGFGVGYTGLASFFPERYWYQTAVAYELAPTLGLGWGARLITTRWEKKYLEMDLGLMYQTGPWRVGLLIQTLGADYYNLRPGIAWVRNNLTLSFDIYDLSNKHQERSWNWGMEYRLDSSVHVRAGVYRVGLPEGPLYTLGWGKGIKDLILDGTVLWRPEWQAAQLTVGYHF